MERRSKEQIREAILEAVIACKYEAGGGDIQITQVAARAGISTRTLNRYFPDKDRMIYLAAIRFLNARYAAMTQVYLSKGLSGKTGLERIRYMLEMHADYYRSNPVDATMVDAANLRYTLGSLEAGYPQMQIGLDLRAVFLANMELGRQDGSISKDLDERSTWIMVAATYNGLLHRFAYLRANKCEIIDRETFFRVYSDYVGMIERHLRP